MASSRRRLSGTEPKDIAQDENRALLRQEMPKADDERQCDRLLSLVSRVRSGSIVRDALEHNVRSQFAAQFSLRPVFPASSLAPKRRAGGEA